MKRSRWVCLLAVDETPIELSFRKFGLRAVAGDCESEEAAAALVETCLQRLERALPLVEKKLIKPMINEALGDRRITVANQFMYFLEMYQYLRERAEEASHDAKLLKPVTTHSENGSSTEFPAFQRARHAEFDAHSSLFALFSMLEHLLMIDLSLHTYEDSVQDIAGFLRLTWHVKFKRLLDLSDPATKNSYDILKTLADENRNPSAHGGIDRNATNLSVHLHGYSAVPVGVFPGSSSPTYTFRPRLSRDVFPFQPPTHLDPSGPGWDAIDEVMDWLRRGPLAAAYSYGESGLPVLLDDDSRSQASEAVLQGEIDELIDYRGWMVDRAANMDW